MVGVIKDYKVGGRAKSLNPMQVIDNLSSGFGLFTQYVHLTMQWESYKSRRYCKARTSYRIDWYDRQNNNEHLHFNVLIPIENEDGLKSTPIEFIENYKGEDLGNSGIRKKVTTATSAGIRFRQWTDFKEYMQTKHETLINVFNFLSGQAHRN